MFIMRLQKKYADFQQKPYLGHFAIAFCALPLYNGGSTIKIKAMLRPRKREKI